MMKTRFNNSMTAHVWAQQNQQFGHSEHMKFNGPFIFSYSELIGVIAPSGQAFTNDQSYFVTTSIHRGIVSRAVANQDIRVPDLGLLNSAFEALAAIRGNKYVPEFDSGAWDRARRTVREWSETHILEFRSAVSAVLHEFGMHDSIAVIGHKAETKARIKNRKKATIDKRDARGRVSQALKLTADMLRKRMNDAIEDSYSSDVSERKIGSFDRTLLNSLKFANANKYGKRTCDHLRSLRRTIKAKLTTIHEKFERAKAVSEARRALRVYRLCSDTLAGAEFDPSVRGVFSVPHDSDKYRSDDRRTEHVELATLHGYMAAQSIMNSEIIRESLRMTIIGWLESVNRSETIKQLRESRELRASERESVRRENDQRDRVERLQLWLGGANVSRPYGMTDDGGGSLIRAVNVSRDDSGNITGGSVETSQGAVVPVRHAIAAYLLASRCRENGKTWERNGSEIRIGQFRVDRIEESGDFRAGCHRMTWSTMHVLASKLSVAVGTE